MSDRRERVRITNERLARMRTEAAEARARTQAAWTRAASAPPPAAATRDEPERPLRTLALALATVVAFLPAALLADGGGSLVPLTAAAKSVLAVLFLSLVPAYASARAERAPEAEDLPAARTASRFSPLAVGVLLALSLPMAWLRWYAVEVALLVQFPVALYLHVPRARACHVFCVLWGALASAVLDERAAIALGPAFGLVVLAAVLDRSLDVRVLLGLAAPAPVLRPLFAAAGIVFAVGVALFGIAFACVRSLVPRLPSLEQTTRATRRAAEHPQPLLPLLLALAAIVLVLAAYHLVFGRGDRTDEARGEEEEPPPAPTLEALGDEARLAASAWPAGARREVVERYLEHLARLARLGTPRRPGQAPLEVAESVGARAPGLLERARRLARVFHGARYSPEVVGEEQVASADEDARAIEERLGDRHEERPTREGP